MSESAMRQTLVKAMRALDAVPIENKLKSGTPDVNYMYGWMELKWLRTWPKQGAPVKIRHYTKQQRHWLRRHGRRGGVALLVLQVRAQWLFFHWSEGARDEVGVVYTQQELEQLAALHLRNGLRQRELLSWLNSHRPQANGCF